MATIYSGYANLSQYVKMRVKVEYSGSSATAQLLWTRTNTWSGTESGSNLVFACRMSGTPSRQASVTFNFSTSGQQTDKVMASISFTIRPDHNDLWHFYFEQTSFYSNQNFDVTIPIQYTAPDTPTISVGTVNAEDANIDYGTASFGNPSTGTVYLYGGTTANPTTEIDNKTTTGTSTFNWSSLSPNTTYYVRARAYNGQLWSDYSADATFTTLYIAKLYGSVNNQTKRIKKLYGSVNGQSKQIVKMYGSVNGVTKRIF